MNSGFPLDKPLRKDYNITALYERIDVHGRSRDNDFTLNPFGSYAGIS